ncbi:MULTISPECIES: DUF7079 family protein [Pseudomonas]|uniref:DUF7079 domain-containing protein n=1 Tax=Pseudomonas solani TaxID=2731552 RepID=A0AAU7Y2Z1_9PSED|nr:hypothetical protein [Pseudomonas sp. TUM22785]WCD80384.1 hypothetical protein PI990_31210 [Pseudomonas sp. TUM22785]
MSDAARERVWLALSELWLDTELDDADLRRIADALRTSALPPAELEAIYLHEVAPVLWLNAWSVAGVWSGFDPDWLFEHCQRNQVRRASRWFRWRCRLLRRPMTYANREQWQQVIHRVVEDT